MAIEHFRSYLLAYEENYYTQYIQHLDVIGDLFCALGDAELQRWIDRRQGDLSLHPFQKNTVRNISSWNVDRVPSYAFALQQYFHKDYLYPEDRYLLEERKRVTKLEQRLADLCHAGRSTIASWKSGVRIPDKYRWFVLALYEFELNFWELQPFLDMVGCNIDMTCLDDVILFYALCAQKTQQETFLLLNAYNCWETIPLFAPAQERRK